MESSSNAPSETVVVKNYRGNNVEVTKNSSRDDLLTTFGKLTLGDRYLIGDESYQDLFARVSGYYSDNTAMAQRVYDAMSQHWFMPATPILANGGTNRGYPISCFLTSVDDSLEGIFDTWRENGWLSAKGGGVGTYWGQVRSMDEPVGEVGTTSGVISFIKMQDSQTLGVSQGSLRRGSAAVYLDIDHPEIEEFVDIRRPSGDANRRCLNVHHGINVTDAFMEAVVAGQDFDLRSPRTKEVLKTVNARDLWMKILKTRLETGEPYLIFIDTVNRKRPESYVRHGLRVKQSNLCSEIALTTGIDHHGRDRTAVCCLASVNAYTSDQWLGDEQFLHDVLVFQDNVMEDFIRNTDGVAGFEKARYSAFRERSIGLGWMGFISHLQAKGISVESMDAHYENVKIWGWLRKTGDKINETVALERGANPDCAELGIMKRWTHFLSIAPTASISIIAGCASPCHDPFPENIFTQKTLSGSVQVKNPVLEIRLRQIASDKFVPASALEEWMDEAWASIAADLGSVRGLSFMSDHDKEVFRTWREIDQKWLVHHMAARDQFLTQMASNNLFMPPDCDVRELHNLHKSLWERGVQSAYYLRSESLARIKEDDVSGELPAPAVAHEVVLRDRGEAFAIDDPYAPCAVCQ